MFWIAHQLIETGSTRKASLSFWFVAASFVAASRKKSFHVSVTSHNAEVKLCDLYQFAEVFSGIASCKMFWPSFIFHVPSFLNKLHLANALFARTQTSFGVGQTVYFSFINRNVSSKQILFTWFIIFPFSCLQMEESNQSIWIQQINVPFMQMCNARLVQYGHI